ncbi:MAG: hypothetical protein ACTSQP_05620 [Promethearchaeota archaeon]
MEEFELYEILDKVSEHNKNAGDPICRIAYANSDYWFIIKKEIGYAVNPVEFIDSNGDSGLEKYAGIAYEIYDHKELYVWGFAIDPQTKELEFIEIYDNPEELIKEHYKGTRKKFDFKRNEHIGERVILHGKVLPLSKNKFKEITDDEFMFKAYKLTLAYDIVKNYLFKD